MIWLLAELSEKLLIDSFFWIFVIFIQVQQKRSNPITKQGREKRGECRISRHWRMEWNAWIYQYNRVETAYNA
jgi:hypothetical protein